MCEIKTIAKKILKDTGVGSITEPPFPKNQISQVVFIPTFHPESCITISEDQNSAIATIVGFREKIEYTKYQKANNEKKITSKQNIWEEILEISGNSFQQYQLQTKALQPLYLYDGRLEGIDGIHIYCEFYKTQEENNSFCAQNPSESSNFQIYCFIKNILDFVYPALEEKHSLEYFKTIYELYL